MCICMATALAMEVLWTQCSPFLLVLSVMYACLFSVPAEEMEKEEEETVPADAGDDKADPIREEDAQVLYQKISGLGDQSTDTDSEDGKSFAVCCTDSSIPDTTCLDVPLLKLEVSVASWPVTMRDATCEFM